MEHNWLIHGVIVVGVGAICCLTFYGKKSSEHFPGPPSEPLLGHLRILTQNSPWAQFADWARLYGDTISLSVLGQPILVLHKAEDAYDLLQKRGHNYSDRPRTVLQGEMIGFQHFLAITRYGDAFRLLRHYTHLYFNSRDHISLYPLLEAQVKILLSNLAVDQERFEDHFDRLSAAIVVKSAYGHEILSNDDEYVKLAAVATSTALSLGAPGLNIVDLLPFLRYVPSWFPGATIMKRARESRKLVARMINEPYEKVKAQRTCGLAEPSLVNSLLEDYEQSGVKDEQRENLMKCAAAQIYAAGTETSADLMLTFILMMIRHPKVARKAQEEIDMVLGNENLPSLEDRPALPYIDCILKECLRINPPGPLGVAHVSMQDDIYKQKQIKSGTILFPNIWQMMRDERFFPDAETFDPDRFLSKLTMSENEHVHPLNRFRPDDPSSLAFGFGRRICPGRYFADASAWLVMANVLAAFNLLPPVDPTTGKDVLPELDLVGGVTARPKSFTCRITVREKKHTLVIQQK